MNLTATEERKPMNKVKLRLLLQQQTGSAVIHKGYNYAMYSLLVPAKQIDEVVKLLRANKTQIEQAMQVIMKESRPEIKTLWELLPFVCLKRPRSIIIPIPLHTPVNLIVEALPELPDSVKIPSWS